MSVNTFFNEQNLIDVAFAEWINHQPHLVIWGGAALLGGKVSRILDKIGVKYDAIAVSRDYVFSEESTVVCLEDYLMEHKCQLIVAFKGYKPEMLDTLNKCNIEKVYTLDFQGRYAVGWDSKITATYFRENENVYRALLSMLVDEVSREAMVTFIKQKMIGFYSKDYSSSRQYFEDEIISFGDREVFVDCGGFDGEDTAEFLRRASEGAEKTFIFEPDIDNFKVIEKRFESFENISCINKGVGSEQKELRFSSGQGSSSNVNESGDTIICVDTIDSVLRGEKVTFIKMDIEGSELDALHGAENTIRMYHPKLAICVYHRAEDLFTIPQYILEINPQYKLFFRSYHSASTEAVLYAI